MRTLALLVVLTASLAAAAGVALNFNSQYSVTDCPAGGSSAVVVVSGSYLLTVTDADAYFCQGATCASGGVKLPSGTVMHIGLAAGSYSCRSATSSADIQLTLAN